MMKTGCLFRLSKLQPNTQIAARVACGVGIAIFLMTAGIASAQTPTPAAPLPVPETRISAPQGYVIHQSVDLGGRMASPTGSNAMYDTLVNMQSGPRVLGETFEMHVLPGQKSTLVDSLQAFGSGFGGDPYNFAKLDFHKGKLYEFSGIFRRDRQYFDYDLLGNPNIISGQSIPIGPSNAPTGQFILPVVNQSPVMFNTVRRMTDTNLTLFPISNWSFRAGYSQNIFQGPSLTPSYNFGKNNALVAEYQRNSSDDFTGGIDWKPIQGTKLTLEEQIDHYKGDSYFTLNPNGFLVQEADGTPVDLGNWDSSTPYGISSCNTGSMGSAYSSTTKVATILSAPQTAGGRPIINPACDVATSYTRTQPTRILTPTEIFRLQCSSIKNVAMNGDLRYTNAKMEMPNYNDSFNGLNGAATSIVYAANGSAHRAVVAADYGIVWQATKRFDLSDQISYSNVQQPGATTYTSKTTVSTPTTVVAGNNGYETINYAGPFITTVAANGASSFTGAAGINIPNRAYFGQRLLTNNLTGTWDATPGMTLSLTYRHSAHMIAENLFASTGTGATFVVTDPGGNPGDVPIGVNGTNGGTVKINEDGGILTAALRPTANWTINGSVEMLYNDNAFTPVTPRQTRQYRVHTLFRPKPWATISGAYNDVEHHNNTNNQQGLSGNTAVYAGPLEHVDYSRVVGLGAQLFPNDRYGIDFNYVYSDVYTADNICYLGAAAAGVAAAVPANGAICPGSLSSRTATYDFGPALDFVHSPTQFGSAAITYSPVKQVHSNVGYHISSVNGTRFYNDARDVAGSLVSTYQTPFVNVAWTVHPGLTWKAEYNFYGYGEGGPSGAENCTLTPSTAASGYVIVPCSSAGVQTGMNISPAGETAPRNFHANNVALGVHYEF